MTGNKGYQGNVPSEQDGWKFFDGFRIDGVKWRMFKKTQSNSDWVSWKVVAMGRVPKKANYWLASNRKTKAMSLSRDYKIMSESRLELLSEVVSKIKGENQ